MSADSGNGGNWWLVLEDYCSNGVGMEKRMIPIAICQAVIASHIGMCYTSELVQDQPPMHYRRHAIA